MVSRISVTSFFGVLHAITNNTIQIETISSYDPETEQTITSVGPQKDIGHKQSQT